MAYISLSYAINKAVVTEPSVNDTKFRNFIKYIGNKMVNKSRECMVILGALSIGPVLKILLCLNRLSIINNNNNFI